LAQGRRVRLIVRRVEPWTVLKFSVLLYVTLYLVILVAGGVLWTAATVTGLRANIEKFIGDLIASDNFHLLGGTVAKASILGGLVMVVMGTGVNVLMAVLYNLISDVVGGIVVQFEERPRRRDRVAHDGAVAEPTAVLRPARGGAIAAMSDRVARVRSGLRERSGPVPDDEPGTAELEGGRSFP
jgi:hypothetical protein